MNGAAAWIDGAKAIELAAHRAVPSLRFDFPRKPKRATTGLTGYGQDIRFEKGLLVDLDHASLDDLYAELGKQLEIDGFGGDDLELLMARARTWFAANARTIRGVVCPGHEKFGVRALESATVADALAAHFGRPTAFTVAAIVAKLNLDSFCSVE